MISKRMVLRLAQVVLVAATTVSATGCRDYFGQLATQYPALAPYLGGRATPIPFSIKTGNLRGMVLGAEGETHPVPLAFVTTGSFSTYTGNPVEGDVQESEQDDGKAITVMHDFDDGKGPVLTERRLRKKPGGPDAFDKYVYLRKGEFFLEQLPEGVATLSASSGNVTSGQTLATVYASATTVDVKIPLYIPTPVENEDGSTPHIVEWTGIKPENGITVSVQRKETTNANGVTSADVSINYKPDPPDVAVELKAPPGSGGTVIREISLAYVWMTPKRQANSEPPLVNGPIRFPISPVIVSAAQAASFGPPTIISVPVGSASLRAIFNSNDLDEQPGLVIAKMQFIGEDGFAVQGKNLEPLEVSCVLRSL